MRLQNKKNMNKHDFKIGDLITVDNYPSCKDMAFKITKFPEKWHDYVLTENIETRLECFIPISEIKIAKKKKKIIS